jgi:hypothetical protein
MRDIRLPDGTWVTTAFTVQSHPQCPDDTCTWEDFGPPTPPGLLPVPVQMQKCPRCCYVRGRYLGSLDQDSTSSLKIGDQEFAPKNLFVIATPLNNTNLMSMVLGQSVCLTRCIVCRCPVFIDSTSLELAERGARIVCIACASVYFPNLKAGVDPDTGRTLTLKEIINHPNCVGGYSRDDIKEVTPD